MAGKITGRESIHRDSQDDYESNDVDEDSEEEQTKNEKSLTKTRFSNSKNKSIDASLNKSRRPVQRANSFLHERSSIPLESAPPQSSGFVFWIIIIALGVVLVAVLVYQRSETERECSFLKLQKKYPNQNKKLWTSLQYGNEDILNDISDKPAVFLLVHYGDDKANSLIHDIALNSGRCFDSNPNIKRIDFESKEAKKDYGHVIETYKNTIQEGNVILIANLNKIPGEAANALHSICDTVTPLVKKVIIFLSLTVERNNIEEKTIDVAVKTLKQLWQHTIVPSELDPIITRVTDQVFLLESN